MARNADELVELIRNTLPDVPVIVVEQTPRPLYLSDEQIRRRLGLGEKAWRSAKKTFERQGMPRPDPVTGKRFWPAVRAFFYRRHGLATMAVPQAPDGEENLEAF